ncbi:MAG: hypothetical protein U9N07_05650 [Euryarchaeota archaeon]|nr:hypothetical protein [Euryarchaeota archaeon]
MEKICIIPGTRPEIIKMALSKNPVIYHRGERRGRRVLRLIRSSAFSAYSAVKFKDIVISLDFPIVPIKMSPVVRACERQGVDWFMVHAGQERSCDVDRVFFEQLGLPDARYNPDARVPGQEGMGSRPGVWGKAADSRVR